MRIAMIGQKGVPFKEEGGGIERHVEELGGRLVERGHEVFVYVRPRVTATRFATWKGMHLIRRPSIPTKNLDTITHTLICTIDALFRNFDVMHFHGVGPSTLAWLPRVFRPRVKVVATFHAQDRLHSKWSWFARLYLWFGEWAAVHFPQVTITVSHALEAICKKQWPKRRRNIIAIPNGVSPPEVTGDPSLVRPFGLEPRRYILTVARLIRSKGIHVLIQAFRATQTDLKLVIVGAPSFTRKYQAHLRDLAAGDARIVFTGFQTGKKLASLYENAFLYVHPSEVEGLSLTILEAMSHGVPVLISNIPENLESIDHAGYSFHVGDRDDLRRRITELVADPERLRATGERGKEFAIKHFSWDKVADMTEAVYRRLVIGN